MNKTKDSGKSSEPVKSGKRHMLIPRFWLQAAVLTFLIGFGVLVLVYLAAVWANLELLRSVLATLAPYSAFALIVMFQSTFTDLSGESLWFCFVTLIARPPINGDTAITGAVSLFSFSRIPGSERIGSMLTYGFEGQTTLRPATWANQASGFCE